LACAAAAFLTVAVSACSSGAQPPGQAGAPTGNGVAPVANGASQVAVTLTGDDGGSCSLDNGTAAAGPVTFAVTNKSATAITEVELQSNSRILGEKENLAPGLPPVSFTVTLGGGSYQIYCPGAAQEAQNFTVTGQAAAAPSGTAAAVLADGTKGYAEYVNGVVDGMVDATNNLKSATDTGDVAKAKAAFALARPFYERIESDVDGFVLPGFQPTDNSGNLDYLIDMRESTPIDAAVGWSGFHAIERDLWQGGAITDETKKYSTDLVANVGKLQGVVAELQYRPEDLANGAAGLLEEVQSGKITGEEEQFSHLDLLDFAANVEGAQQAYASLRPGLEQIDSELVKNIDQQFESVQTTLDGYRDPNAIGGFKPYTPELQASDAAKLTASIQPLHESLSAVAQKVV